jgi:hypothetical protein
VAEAASSGHPATTEAASILKATSLVIA